MDTEDKMRRLANFIECKTAEIICDLLAESRSTAARNVMVDADDLIRELRNLADLYSKA